MITPNSTLVCPKEANGGSNSDSSGDDGNKTGANETCNDGGGDGGGPGVSHTTIIASKCNLMLHDVVYVQVG